MLAGKAIVAKVISLFPFYLLTNQFTIGTALANSTPIVDSFRRGHIVMRLITTGAVNTSVTSITSIMRPSSTAAISSYEVCAVFISSLMGVICKLIYCQLVFVFTTLRQGRKCHTFNADSNRRVTRHIYA